MPPAAGNSRLDAGGAHALRHGLGPGGVDERPLAVRLGDVPDPLLDLGLDFRVLLHPLRDLLVAALRRFAALHFPEHELPNELLLRELLVVPVEIGVLLDELVDLGIDLRIHPGRLFLRLSFGDLFSERHGSLLFSPAI